MTTGNVIGLNGKRPSQLGEPRQGLIEALADALEMAKSGRLQSFIGTGFTADGNRLACWGGHHENVYEMIGAINWLEHEYVARQTETVFTT
jgi:hypothetical protein